MADALGRLLLPVDFPEDSFVLIDGWDCWVWEIWEVPQLDFQSSTSGIFELFLCRVKSNSALRRPHTDLLGES
jgi:hypothetical protein